MNLRSTGFLLVLCLGVAAFAAAEPPPSSVSAYVQGLSDNAALRQKYFTSLITAPKASALSFGEKVFIGAETTTLVRARARNADFLIEFLNGGEGGFEKPRAGNYIIQREPAKGYILQAKVLLLDDPTCYARLYPQAENTRLDVVLYGAVVKKGLFVPNLIYYVLSKPFAETIATAKGALDWVALLAANEQGAALAAALRADSGLPSPAPALTLAALMRAESPEVYAAELSARGVPVSELKTPSGALGFSDDRDPAAPRLPYGEFPRYEAGRGLPAETLRAAITLDLLAAPALSYAVFGEDRRFLFVPEVDEEGRFRLACFGADGELGRTELAALLRGGRFRIFRVHLR